MLEIQKTQKLGSWDLFWVMFFWGLMGFIRKKPLGVQPPSCHGVPVIFVTSWPGKPQNSTPKKVTLGDWQGFQVYLLGCKKTCALLSFWGFSGLHKCFFVWHTMFFCWSFWLVFFGQQKNNRKISPAKVVFRRNTLVKIPPGDVDRCQADQWPIHGTRWTVLWCLDGPALRKGGSSPGLGRWWSEGITPNENKAFENF